MQSGFLRKAVELVVPIQMLSEFIEASSPKVVTPPPAPPSPVRQPAAKAAVVKPQPAPQPLAVVSIAIAHQAELYRLQVTKLGKLILT